jgi:hypothetical protein
VIAETGRPIKDAKVSVGREPADARAQTDEKGRFVVDGLSTTDTLLTVTHENYVTGTASISPEVGKTTEVRITLAEGGMIEGIVTRGGAPAAGETVLAVQQTDVASESPWPHQVTHQAITDAQGHYLLESVAPGLIQLQAVEQKSDEHRDPEWARAVTNVEPGRTAVVNFDLPVVQSVIEGVVLVEGQPSEQAEVQASIVSDYGRFSAGVPAKPDGTYRLDRLPAGTVTLQANAYTPAGKLKRSVDLTLGESQVVQNDFLFSAACVVSGTVTGVLGGEQAAVAAMTEFPSGASTLTLEDLMNMGGNLASDCDVSPEGTFRLEGLEPGSYTIVAVAITGALNAQENRSPVRMTHVQVELRAGTEVQVNLALR